MTFASPGTRPGTPIGPVDDDSDEGDMLNYPWRVTIIGDTGNGGVFTEHERAHLTPPGSLLRICDGIRQTPSSSSLSQAGLSLSSAPPRDFHLRRSQSLADQVERYTTLLAAYTSLQNSYDDLRSSYQALQSAHTSTQLAHSALLFGTSASYTSLPPRTPHQLTTSAPNSPINRPATLSDPPVPVPISSPPPPTPHIQLKPKPLDIIAPPLVSRESLAQAPPLSIGTSFSRSSDDSSASHVSRLKTLLNDRTSELNSLQAFLSKHDEWSGAQVVQAVEDLNGELARLASAVSDAFVIGSDIDSNCSDTASVGTKSPPHLPNSKSDQETHDRLKEALGSAFYQFIFTRSGPPSDPSPLVQYAIQAWQVWCCSRIIDSFCFGLPSEVERLLADVWESIKREGAPPQISVQQALTSALLMWD